MSHILLFEKYLEYISAPLYCAKRKSISLELFKHDMIKGNDAGGQDKKFDLKKGKYQVNRHGKINVRGISLTRDKNLRFNPISEAVSDIQITFNTDKLKTKYKIIPYDYYYNKSIEKYESEELLVGDLKDASKYITDIEFNSGTIYDFVSESEKIDFLWSVGAYLIKHPHITVSSVSYFGKPNNLITRDFFIKWIDKIKRGDFKDIPLKSATSY